MQRMFNLDKWVQIADENGLHFTNPRPRRVSIEVNAPVRSSLSVIDHTGEVHFLALVEGRDTVEFNSLGEFSLICDNGGVMIYTADGADISMRVLAPVAFTRIMERRRRNPELEEFARAMQANSERQIAQLAHAFEQRLAAAAKAAAPVNIPPGDVPRVPAPVQPGDAPPGGDGTDPTNGQAGGSATPSPQAT